MTMARSPRYPLVGLSEAIAKAKKIYDEDYQNKIPKALVATHMGYGSLNGKSLGVISAVSKYGLIDGRADQMWVTDRALAIIAHEPGSPERTQAIIDAAREPELFVELDNAFPGKASDAAIRSYLLTKLKFLPEAADRCIRSYRETRDLVEAESKGYTDPGKPEPETPPVTPQPQAKPAAAQAAMPHFVPPVAKPGMLQEMFTLDEGAVTLTVPATLSPESYQDMADRLEIFLRGLKRRSDAEAARRHHDREDVPDGMKSKYVPE